MSLTQHNEKEEAAAMNIWDHVKWEHAHPRPLEPQYWRDVAVFTCPTCGEQISSKYYSYVGYFQQACHDHICPPSAFLDKEPPIDYAAEGLRPLGQNRGSN